MADNPNSMPRLAKSENNNAKRNRGLARATIVARPYPGRSTIITRAFRAAGTGAGARLGRGPRQCRTVGKWLRPALGGSGLPI